jgi:hypothetical protein
MTDSFNREAILEEISEANERLDSRKQQYEEPVLTPEQEEEEEDDDEVDVGKELRNAFVGGVRDTASSIVTAPERVQDMFNGQMEAAGEDYEPEFNPFKQDEDELNKTWWGNLIRGTVHFGTMAAGVVLGAKAVAAGAAGTAVGGAASWLAGTGASSTIAGSLARGAVVGGTSDLLSEYSQDANMLGELRDHYGLIDTPLSTKDADHPVVKTFKNMVEGMGIGIVVDGVASAIGRSRVQSPTKVDPKPNLQAIKDADRVHGHLFEKAHQEAKIAVDKNLRNATAERLMRSPKQPVFSNLSPEQQIQEMIITKKRNRTGLYDTWSPPETADQRAARKIAERNENIDSQIVEVGTEELKNEGPGAYKGKGVYTDTHQANPTSTEKVYDIYLDVKRINEEASSELGSTGTLMTDMQIIRTADGGVRITDEAARQFFGEERFQMLLKSLKERKLSLDDVFASSFAKAQEIIGGRDAGTLSPDEFWKPIMDDISARTGGKDSIDYWAIENVIAADIVNTALFRKIRDMAAAGFDMKNMYDVDDIGAPVTQIRNNLIVGLTEAKRSRYTISTEFRSLQARDPKMARKAMEETFTEIHASTKDQVDMMLELGRADATDDFLHAVLEAFSISNDVHNWTDFDGFMRRRLKGQTTADGVKKTGLLIRELQGVMINSVLSGPKTPMRAIMGTSTAVFTRPMAQMLGGMVNFGLSGFRDTHSIRVGLATANAAVQMIPESFKYFKTRVNGYMSGELSTIRNRYQEYNAADNQWKLMGHWAETRGTAGDKFIYRTANVARTLNDMNLFTYSTKLMAATDDVFTMILARMRAKEKAMNAAFDARNANKIPDITPDLIKEIETREYAQIFDPMDGSVSDAMLKHMKEEATFTKDVGMLGKSMDRLFDAQPLLKPFYLFARTGINGLEYSLKHAPGFNFLVKEFNDIAFAKPDNLENVTQYGITNALELRNAQALQAGRFAIGTAVVTMATQHYLSGNLSGNGPSDVKLKRVWEAAGWKPRSIKLGDVWVSYDSMEPFSNILAMIADLGDNQKMMGDEFVEQGLGMIALGVGKSMISKTYLQGLQQVTDLFGNDPKKFGKIAANLANNQVPLSSLRNEIGRLINPVMRELNSGFSEQIRNRNLITEKLAGDNELPYKYDILNGEPIRNWEPMTRIFNMVSPIQFNLDQSPGRQFLLNSRFDMRTSVYTAPGNPSVDLSDSPRLRSLFQKAIGDHKVNGKNLEQRLADLAKLPYIKKSMQDMDADFRAGFIGKDPMGYPHNEAIKAIMESTRKAAWAKVSRDADAIALINASRAEAASKYLQQRGETEASNDMYQRFQNFQNSVNR